MNTEPTIIIRLDGDSLVYRPGETFSGQYWLDCFGHIDLKAIEASILWYTEGKGDEDMVVHEFWRRDADDEHPIDASQPERFETTLPNSPLSYDGRIVKIRWCMRVRAFPSRGREIVGEKPFQLGNVPPIRPPASP